MTPQQRVGIVGAALFALSATGLAGTVSGEQPRPPASSATAAAQASPELVGALSKAIGATPEQSAGAAGALFGVAKSRLKANEFSQIAKAVPGMEALLNAAPPTGGPTGTSGTLSQLAGSAGGLATAASAFSKLGLSPDLVAKAVPVVTSFVTKSGGAQIGNLLAGALK